MESPVVLGVLVTLLAVIVDMCFVWWALSSTKGWPWRASVAAVGIQLCGVGGTLLIVKDPWLLGLNAFGHGLGTYIAVKHAARNRG